jgi:hypothetical protein
VGISEQLEKNIQVLRPDGAGRYCVSGAGWHTFLLLFWYTSIRITDIAHSQTAQGTAVFGLAANTVLKSNHCTALKPPLL